jgi:cytochrome c556
MRKLILAISTVALAVSAAYADPIADRKAIMKERGGILGPLGKMAKGETAFDAAAVKTALEALKANEAKLDIDALFAAGTDKGDTKAAPKIWEDMNGFKAADTKLKEATDAALAAPPQDVNALGATMGAIGGACGGCHKEFRLPS